LAASGGDLGGDMPYRPAQLLGFRFGHWPLEEGDGEVDLEEGDGVNDGGRRLIYCRTVA
jgi:hypothetical protein